MTAWFCFLLLQFRFSPAAPPEKVAAPPPVLTDSSVQLDAPSSGRVSSILEKQAQLWEVVGRSRDQQRRYTDSQTVLQEERLEWMAQRDRLTVTISATNRAILKKDRRLRELVEAVYKLTHATFGQAHVLAGRRSVPRDGRIVLLTLLEREILEKRSLQADLKRLRDRRASVDETVSELESLEENFRLLALEAESLIKRSLFEIEPLERRLEGVNKLMFDAQDWNHYNRIRSIRNSVRNENAGTVKHRGMLVRPVAGPVLPGSPMDRPGVYLSGQPGDSVRAPEAGTVRFVGEVDGFGTVIVIEHDFGVHSIVGRIELPSVKAGDIVRRAQFIAKVPASRSSSHPVYVELRSGREVLDPHLWLKNNE
ncbi:peptidoglycan DD-metalloendopeptidase family protein [Myxococcota bacterium]|nr:peptidoglycan DD-metalloendopeptidase family protein [Myxococcota bacterium]